MRIAIDCRKIRDYGIGTYIENLVLNLVRIDTRNEYVLLCFESDAERLGAVCPLKIVTAGLYSVAELLAISKAIGTCHADLFHSPHYVIPYFLPCPAVVTLHDIIHLLYPENLPGLPARLYARHFIRRAVSVATAVITVSDSSRADILGRFPAATNRVYRVYNGVDPNFSTNGEPEKADRPYFLSVGNNKPHKNLSLILDAYARFSSNHDGIDLVLTGTGPLPDQPLPPGIRALGYIDKNHLARLYRGSLALICASRYEGFGLPAVEAQASGTPVIASGIPVFLETLGTSATFFKQGEISDLVAAMKRLALNAHLRSDLGEKGIENASRFSFDACARETLAIYEAVAIGHISEKAGRQRKRRNAKEEPDK